MSSPEWPFVSVFLKSILIRKPESFKDFKRCLCKVSYGMKFLHLYKWECSGFKTFPLMCATQVGRLLSVMS